MENKVNLKRKTTQGFLLFLSFFVLYSFAYLERYSIANLTLKSSYSFLNDDLNLVFTYAIYGLGNLMNGKIADRIGGKKSVILGAGISFILNLMAAYVSNGYILFFFWIINSYIQSFLWLGGVLLVKGFCIRNQWGIGIGLINSASGVAHILTFISPDFVMAYSSKSMILVIVGLCLMGFMNNSSLKSNEFQKEKKTSNKRDLLFWCGLAFCSSLCRYGILNWIPVYYASSLQDAVIDNHTGEIVLAIGMAIGTLVLSILSEKYFKENRALFVAAIAASCGMLIAVFPSQTEITTILTGVFFTGFFLYGINGILWLTAVSEENTGYVTGIFNFAAYMGSTVEEIVSLFLFSNSENRFLVFIFMEGICILMIILALYICRKNTIILDSRSRESLNKD